MGELSLEEAGTDRHRTVTWTDPLVGAALARDLSGLEYLRAMAEGRIPGAPIAALLGMSAVSVEKGSPTHWQIEERDAAGHVTTPAVNIKWAADLGTASFGSPVMATDVSKLVKTASPLNSRCTSVSSIRSASGRAAR